MSDIHAIILTLDEEKHIARCIESLTNQCASILVVDSGSKDATTSIAERLGARVVYNPWVNYAAQLNFGIAALAGRGGWLLRIDADEVLEADGTESLPSVTSRVSQDTDGVLVQRRIHFMGRRIRHGGIEPSWQLRLWRNGRGGCEQRWMDEHIAVTGKVIKSQIVLSDINLNSLSWWTDKHNRYASRESIDILNRRYGFMAYEKLPAGASPQAKARRFLKEHVYSRLPSAMRALLYFLYRYVFLLGFLDGRVGWYFHVLQGFWYRTLVDAKVAEIEAYAAAENTTIVNSIRACTGLEPLGAGQMKS